MKAAKIIIGKKLINKEIQVPLELSCLTIISVPSFDAALVISFNVESLGNTKDVNSSTVAVLFEPKNVNLDLFELFEAYHTSL